MSYTEWDQTIFGFLWLPSFQSSSMLKSSFSTFYFSVCLRVDTSFSLCTVVNWAIINMKVWVRPSFWFLWIVKSLYVDSFNVLTRAKQAFRKKQTELGKNLTHHRTPSTQFSGKFNFPIFQIGKLEEKCSFHNIGPDSWSVPFYSCAGIDIGT